MEIIVTDRKSIEAGIIVQSAYVVISIHDPHKQRAKVRKQGGLRDVLFLTFHDAQPTAAMQMPEGVKMMTPEQAAEICRFVELHKGDVGTIVVHCEQGMSRSPAVAAALSAALGLDESRFWREYQPNGHVYRSVLHAYAVRREGGPA